MSPEEKELLRRSIALAEENNDILRSMQRSMRLGRIMTVIYWVFIIGTAVGAYIIFQPYVDQAKSLYESAKSTLNSANSTFSNFRK